MGVCAFMHGMIYVWVIIGLRRGVAVNCGEDGNDCAVGSNGCV